MKIDAETYVLEKVSSKGNKYKALEIYITSNVKKTMFLSDAEYELILLNVKNNTQSSNNTK